ncbi:hypothetical protein BDR03DRAFT_1017806 [Suillus americanus]|nr:hypothetical protein BDR03DRAFT_1017806 [Suillus americanus]
MTTCSPSKAKAFKSAYAADIKASKPKFEFVFTASWAAGTLSMYVLKMADDHYNIYWETGMCSAVLKRPSESPAPTTFNVIDTSNLLDHVSTLNILIVTSPILQQTPSATFNSGDIATIGLLLGLIPVSFVSQFMNRSNMHEVLMHFVKEDVTQNHEHLAWKLIGSAEKLVTDLDCPINIAPEQLAGLLFNIYLNMFSHENMVQKLAMVQQSSESIKLSGIVH